MGPQFNPCGRFQSDESMETILKASMGPQFNPCGRAALGRNPALVGIHMLQWGRSLIPAEGVDKLDQTINTYLRFNGAAV